MPRPVHELDGGHATTAVAGSVQSMSPAHSAAYGPAAPGAILEHVGRRSSKRTVPVERVQRGRRQPGVAILLWSEPRLAEEHHRAAGGGRMHRCSKTLVSPTRGSSRPKAAPYVSSRWRPVFAELPFDSVLLTKGQGTSPMW